MNLESSYQALQTILDKVFLEDLAKEPYCFKLLKQPKDYFEYMMRVRGVDVRILASERCERASVTICIGSYLSDGCYYFQKNIEFAIFKKANFSKEIIRRLEIEQLNNRIDEILKYRQNEKLKAENFLLIKGMFKKYLPFMEHKDENKLSFYSSEKGFARADIYLRNDKSCTKLFFDIDTDTAIALCALASKLLNVNETDLH